MVAQTHVDFDGLVPAIDRRRLARPAVIDGRNFLVNADGPSTAFSREFLLFEDLMSPIGAVTVRVAAGNNVFVLTDKEVLEVDLTNQTYIPRLRFASPLVLLRPWFHTSVGGKFYFVRVGSGLLEYDPVTDVWATITSPDIPAGLTACCAAGGRLVLLGTAIVAWSAIDDGTDLATSTVTGAGAQLLSIMNAQAAAAGLAVYAYSRGFITYTTEGLMKSELVNAVNPFRHFPLSRQHRPICPFAITPLDEETHVFIDEAGMFATQAGGKPEIFQEVFSEYLHSRVLPALDKTACGIIKLDYHKDNGWFCVHLADNTQPGIYTKAWVLYVPSGKWGTFNRAHCNFVDTYDPVNGVGFTLGYIDSDGTLWRFSSTQTDTVYPVDANGGLNNLYHYVTRYEIPPSSAYGEQLMPTVEFERTINEPLTFPGGFAGIYDLYAIVQYIALPPTVDASVEPPPLRVDLFDVTVFYTAEFTGTGLLESRVQPANNTPAALDAYVTLGLFKLVLENELDSTRFSELTEFVIGSLPAANTTNTFEDYINDYLDIDVIEDYTLIADTVEDWGVNEQDSSAFNLLVTASLDGYLPWEDMEQVPELVHEEGSTRHYVTDTTGHYHFIKISADEVGESFSIKLIRLQLFDAGVFI